MTRVLLLSAVLALVLAMGGSQQAFGQGTVMKFSPSTKYASPGGANFTVDVAVQGLVTTNPCGWPPYVGGCGLGAYSFKLSFDPTVIEWVSTANGSFFTGYRPIWECVNAFGHDPENGIVAYQCTTGGTNHGPTGPDGVLSTITFASLMEGSTALTFLETSLGEIDGKPVPHSSQNGTVIVAPHADLAVTKTAPATVTAPGNIAYTVQVTNQGPNVAQSATVVDTLSNDVSYVSASPGCSYAPGPPKVVTCSLGDVAVSQTKTVSVTVSVTGSKAGRSITNVADASSATLDPNAANNHAQASTTVNPANVNIVKSAPGQAAKGATGQYQIVLTSTGPSGAGGVSVTDELPPDVTYVGKSTTQGACAYVPSPPPHKVMCALGDLLVSNSATVTITVTFPNLDLLLCNDAKVQWTQAPTIGEHESEVVCTEVGVPDADGDGCTNVAELGGDLMSGGGREPDNPYDFFDVPVPANVDPAPNGGRNRVVDIGDVLAVLLYAFAEDGGPPNANGVDYDSIKHSCTINRVPDQDEGKCYDRSSASPVSGPPNGVVDIGDVLSVVEQVPADCNTT